jgi:hypothetical protein
MIRPARLAALAVTLIIALAACAPSAGALGTPATPAATTAPSSAIPSDELPSVEPTTPPTATPTQEPSRTPGSPAPTPSGSTAPTPEPAGTPAPTMVVRAYFMMGAGNAAGGVVPVLRTLPATKAVARAAMQALLDGPTADEKAWAASITSSIPTGTTLDSLKIENGVATVVLGPSTMDPWDFTRMGARAQITFTLTQFPTVDAVTVVIGNEQPGGTRDRADYQAFGFVPAIFVDRPAWGASIGNPATISGLTNVFEATFRAQLLDANGDILVDDQVTASCGTGCWGTFAERLTYSVTKAQYGVLRVYDLSAKDGTPENVTDYKVWLTPAT